MTPSTPSFEILLHDSFSDQLANILRKSRGSQLQDQLDKALERLGQHPYVSNANRKIADFPLQDKQGMIYLVTRVGGRSGRRRRYGLFEEKRQVILYHLSSARKDVEKELRNLDLVSVIEDINADFFAENYGSFVRWQPPSEQKRGRGNR
ncbi:MAG: hypothetical protein OXF32_10145 [Anaerolineaceae bacterium]|nr:hypothetical protein [Anaerolineaceae bacterium]